MSGCEMVTVGSTTLSANSPSTMHGIVVRISSFSNWSVSPRNKLRSFGDSHFSEENTLS